MTKELPQESKTQLALAIARGKSVAAWARDSQVPRSTAYRWARQPEVRAAAQLSRRRALDRALRVMAKRGTWASEQIAKLARDAESDSVKFRALRSIFCDLVAVSRFRDLKYRMAEVEAGLRDRTDNANVSGELLL